MKTYREVFREPACNGNEKIARHIGARDVTFMRVEGVGPDDTHYLLITDQGEVFSWGYVPDSDDLSVANLILAPLKPRSRR